MFAGTPGKLERDSAFQSLQRENTTICWMIGIGFTLLVALSTFLRSSGSGGGHHLVSLLELLALNGGGQ